MKELQLNGEAIKLGRAMRGLTQRELARAARLTPRRLSALENDKSPAQPREQAKILRVLALGDMTGR